MAAGRERTRKLRLQADSGRPLGSPGKLCAEQEPGRARLAAQPEAGWVLCPVPLPDALESAGWGVCTGARRWGDGPGLSGKAEFPLQTEEQNHRAAWGTLRIPVRAGRGAHRQSQPASHWLRAGQADLGAAARALRQDSGPGWEHLAEDTAPSGVTGRRDQQPDLTSPWAG